MRILLTAAKLWNGARLIDDPVVEIEDKRIRSIGSREANELASQAEHLDFPGALLAPAFFDVHFHGAGGHDLMEATPEALYAIGSEAARHGTGSYLATTVTAPLDRTLHAVAELARLIQRPELIKTQKVDCGQGKYGTAARPVGIHLEGPFLSHARRGVQPAEHLLLPSIVVFDRLYEAAEGTMRLMTLAPELPGAVELAAHATKRGVRISLGHSDAKAAHTRTAIDAGAVSATHTFNAMRALDHRELGILGTVLTTDTLYAELICDGIHVAPEMVKLWWRAKGQERAILVSDGMSATGMPDGEYQLGGFPVQVENGRATARGVLAGSVLTLDRALGNFVEFTGATVEQGLRLLTANPAAMTGLDQAGCLRVGGAADLVAVDAAGKMIASMVSGQLLQAPGTP